MAVIECGKGHLYDPVLYSSCPYCKKIERAVMPKEIPAAGHIGKTRPIDYDRRFFAEAAREDRMAKERLPDSGGKGDEGFLSGWLVCVKGDSKGRDFKLYSRINTIGRSTSMDVVISRPDISWENHAKLAYSDKNNRFTLSPGESKNLIYVNGEEILIPVILNGYDIIDFGETKFMFVPFCGENFKWDQTL